MAGSKRSSTRRPVQTDTVLGPMSVPDHRHVYAIGVGAKRLTFVSQQQRALNLVWTLSKKRLLKEGSSVAVVGAGLAGVTAAAAADLLGAKVTLFERQAEILHLQRGTHLRFIQPNIYDWPDKGSEDPLTSLPFFNWGAGVAANVVETILSQWSRIAGGVDQRLNHDVREIVSKPDGRVSLVAEGPVSVRTAGPAAPGATATAGTGVYRGLFDLVIVAVGFGLERTLSTVPFRSYWENDNLARTVISGPVPRRFLVSGCGDGGLIDAIRLRIRDFDHARFVRELLSYPGVNSLKDRLRQIDRDASRLVAQPKRQRGARSTPLDDAEIRRLKAHRQSQFLQDHYAQAFSELDRLEENLTRQLRSDTIVYLNGQTPTPLTLDSSILNRVAVFLLIKHGGLRYRMGEVSAAPAAGEYVRVSFRRAGYPTEELEVHEVVVRHGPIRAIDRIFSEAVRRKFSKIDPVADPTRVPHYPRRFWATETLEELTREVERDYAAATFPRALQSLGVQRSGQSLALRIDRDRVAFVVGADTRPASEPTNFETIRVEYPTAPARAIRPSAKATVARRAPGDRRLFCGAGLASVQSWKQVGTKSPVLGQATVGCFVTQEGRFTALLTSASALLGTSRLDVRFVAPAIDDRPVAILTVLREPVVSPRGATLSAGTAIRNEFEAALAVLSKGVTAVPGFEPRLRLPALSGEAEPTRGDRVFKVGLATGLTRGRISQVRVTTEIGGWSGPTWFKNLFAIESETAAPFSGAGDAGALIVRESDGAALGLLIAGSDRSTLAEPIIPTLKGLNCSLLLP